MMEKLNKIIVLGILPILLISSQSAWGHTLSDQFCENLGGLQFDEVKNVCVADLSIVCMSDGFHADLIGGGFRNIGIDQFGNTCTEEHPTLSTGVPVVPPSFFEDLFDFYLGCLNSCGREGVAILIGLTLIVLAIPVVIIFLIVKRLRRRK